MIECYPLIFTRTYDCDYRLIIKPSFIDEKWVMNYIHSATAEIDYLDLQGRQCVFSNSEYIVFGIVSYNFDIINKSTLPQKEELFKYKEDIKKRKIYGFWGFVTKEKNNIATPSCNDYAKLIEKYMPDVWYQTMSDNKTTSEILNINESYESESITPVITGFGKSLFEASDKLMAYFLSEATKRPVSFISNLNRYSQIKNGVFENLSVNYNCIYQMKMDIEEQAKQNQQTNKIFNNNKEISTIRDKYEKNKNIENYLTATSKSEQNHFLMNNSSMKTQKNIPYSNRDTEKISNPSNITRNSVKNIQYPQLDDNINNENREKKTMNFYIPLLLFIAVVAVVVILILEM